MHDNSLCSSQTACCCVHLWGPSLCRSSLRSSTFIHAGLLPCSTSRSLEWISTGMHFGVFIWILKLSNDDLSYCVGFFVATITTGIMAQGHYYISTTRTLLRIDYSHFWRKMWLCVVYTESLIKKPPKFIAVQLFVTKVVTSCRLQNLRPTANNNIILLCKVKFLQCLQCIGKHT